VALKVGERVEGADSIDRAQAALDTFAYGLRTDEANLVVTGTPETLLSGGLRVVRAPRFELGTSAQAWA
jgi:hypothetical protein